MRAEVADRLEAFIEAGTPWEPGAVAALVAELQSVAVADGDILVERLDRFLGAVGLRQEAGVLEPGTRAEIEAVVYPRLWKVMEAIRDGLPDGEVRTRLEVMHRRLARPFVEETAAR